MSGCHIASLDLAYHILLQARYLLSCLQLCPVVWPQSGRRSRKMKVLYLILFLFFATGNARKSSKGRKPCKPRSDGVSKSKGSAIPLESDKSQKSKMMMSGRFTRSKRLRSQTNSTSSKENGGGGKNGSSKGKRDEFCPLNECSEISPCDGGYGALICLHNATGLSDNFVEACLPSEVETASEANDLSEVCVPSHCVDELLKENSFCGQCPGTSTHYS